MSLFLRFFLLLFISVVLPSNLAAQSKPLTRQAEAIFGYLAPDGYLSNDETLNLPELRTLYETRAYRPVWNAQNPEHQPIFLAFMDYMKKLCAEHGLESQDKTIAFFKAMALTDKKIDVVKLDIALTDWVLDIAYELNGQAIDFSSLYAGWKFKGGRENLAEDLGNAFYKGKIYNFLPTLAPNSVAYLHLAQALKLYRTMAEQSVWSTIEAGPILSLGAKDHRVKQVRVRLEAESYMMPLCQTEENEILFDKDLRQALISYQSRNGLKTDGNIGPETVATMNRSVTEKIDKLRANMSRLRAMPHTWPNQFAYVNIADASIKIFKEGTAIYHAQTVVGLPSRRTPFIQSAIHTLILNPTWRIPISIARYDILPKLRKNPFHLQEKGFYIRGRKEDPYGLEIEWSHMKPRQFHYQLRQPPGEKNALGPIKFDFKNDFSVYLHGTPHQEDFVKERRHLSSGCIRLKDPKQIAAVILAGNQDSLTTKELQENITAREEIKIEVEKPLPIYVIYQTTFFPSADISAHFRRDVYGYDRRLLKALRKKQKDYISLFFKDISEEDS
ncbi:MAG TPA: hypothetical protein DD400_01300 [Rhodospirillaceae bacterium]|nr:hypothetical protein [Rhodospirillaceae bacterium]